MIKNCLICGKEFKTFPYMIKKGAGKVCSWRCSTIYRGNILRGRKLSKSHRLNVIEARRIWYKTHRNGMFGKHHSKETRKKMRLNANPWLKGTKGLVKSNSGSFKKGMIPWCKGKKGIHLSPATEFKKGELPINFIGRTNHSAGYIYIYSPHHPFADHHKQVLEHRLVVEKQIGRYLTAKEIVHHLGKKDDNRPKMLMAFISHGVHLRFEKGLPVHPKQIIFDGRKFKK